MAGDSSDAVAEIVERYSGDADMLIPMMQDIQTECGYLPQEGLKDLARALEVPVSRLYSIATFYASFRLMPKGDHTIQLCMGTVCFLKGAEKISNAIREEFRLVPGGTSPDGKFTFSPVNCVGACALAPVMVVDGEYHGGLTPESAAGLLRTVAESGPPEGDEGPGDEAAGERVLGGPGERAGPAEGSKGGGAAKKRPAEKAKKTKPKGKAGKAGTAAKKAKKSKKK